MDNQDAKGSQDVDVCWVCLAPGDSTHPLIHACQCPRTVHKECLARWQLQSVGRRYDQTRLLPCLEMSRCCCCRYCTSLTRHFCVYSEETECRFCHGELPDWRAAYNLPTADPVMTVSHNNVQHLLEVKPGEAGKLEFQANIRNIFGLGLHDVIELDFGCKAPGTGAVLLQHCTLNPQYCMFILSAAPGMGRAPQT